MGAYRGVGGVIMAAGWRVRCGGVFGGCWEMVMILKKKKSKQKIKMWEGCNDRDRSKNDDVHWL
jgi:hypothetical protein